MIDRASHENTSLIGRIARERSEENYRFASRFVSGKTLLDIGGGAGIGHDILLGGGAKSIKSIDPYLASIASKHGSRVCLIQDDFLVHSFAGETFDVITCLGTIFYLPNADAALNKMHQLLKPGGALLINCINQNLVRAYFKMSLEEVDDKFSTAFNERDFSALIKRHFDGEPSIYVQQPVPFSSKLRDALSFWLTPIIWPFQRHPIVLKPKGTEGMFVYAVAHKSELASANAS